MAARQFRGPVESGCGDVAGLEASSEPPPLVPDRVRRPGPGGALCAWRCVRLDPRAARQHPGWRR